jgi:phospholipase A1
MQWIIVILLSISVVSPAICAEVKKPAAAKKPPALSERATYKPAASAQSSGGGSGLVQEWTPTVELKPYQQNYFLLLTNTSQPNNLPTSPNPLNNIVTPYLLDNHDVQFQISLKHDLADFEEFGSLWFGYTQRSFWQFYDRTNSQPFRGTDYEPELIYSLRAADFSVINLGIAHQSNGESVPRSRSWNRYYIQPIIEVFNEGDSRLVLRSQWWDRFNEPVATDDNPDLVEFLGFREIELRYIQKNGWDMSAISRRKSIKLSISAPFSTWLALDTEGDSNVNLQIYYFSGYGESLLDYNQSHVTWGVGILFPNF